jgi:protein required for attachment to host cells
MCRIRGPADAVNLPYPPPDCGCIRIRALRDAMTADPAGALSPQCPPRRSTTDGTIRISLLSTLDRLAVGDIMHTTWDMVNEAVRMRAMALDAEPPAPGVAARSLHNAGNATPDKAFEPGQTPAEHETERFGRSIVGFLEQGHKEGRYQELALCASPHFLGILRALLGPHLGTLVRVEINKDYTHAEPAQLQEQVHAHRQAK